MKNIKSTVIITLLGIFLGLALFPSCDIIEEPYLVKIDSNDGPDTVNKVRKILLEDFTGQQCPNCPKAAQEAQNIKAIYGEQLVIVSIHAGNYSEPAATGNFTADYRTPEGNELNSYFALQGYPMGMVNRAEYGGSLLLVKDSWQSAVDAQADLDIQAWITIDNSYNASTRKLDCSLETEFLADLSGTYNICVYLLESGIVSPQKTLTGTVLDYTHNHMLRTTLNGTWGEPVGTDGQAVTGSKVTNNYSYTLPAEWNADNCAIVAYIYNTETLEIVQAEEVAVN
jgi:hypothetical protein